MRPHVELIAEDDYVWHAAELVGGDAKNYGETGPIPSTLPVRSRSRGGWRGWDGM